MRRLVLILSILIIMFSTIVYADNIYPIESSELILDTREISDIKVEIFTKLDGEYYRKTLEKQNDKWILIETQTAELPPTGLKEDKNIQRDYFIEKALENKLRASGYSLNALPSKLDLSETGYLPPVGKQYEDSCVGWATGYYLRTYQQAKDIGWFVGNNPKHIFSPSFIYNQINDGVDEGSTLQDAGELLKNIGAGTLADFPYIPRDYLTQPNRSVIEKAAIHKIKDWYVLYTNRDSKEYIIRKTKEYLNTGDLPVVGINVGFKWMYPLIEPDGTSIVTTENYTSGGHAVVVVGYDDDLETPEGYGAFKIVNSYGDNWGQSGYAYMTYNAFASAMRSGFAFVDLVNGRIVEETIPVEIEDIVEFQMNFSGSGRYDIKIKDSLDNIIKEDINKFGISGLNIYTWNGENNSGNIVSDGDYKLELVPYKGSEAKLPFILEFEKKSRVQTANAKAYKLDNNIYKLEINITAKEDGKISLYAVNGSKEELIISDDAIEKDESKTYKIDNSKLDLNDKDISIKILLKKP